jgi:hypothetical protein
MKLPAVAIAAAFAGGICSACRSFFHTCGGTHNRCRSVFARHFAADRGLSARMEQFRLVRGHSFPSLLAGAGNSGGVLSAAGSSHFLPRYRTGVIGFRGRSCG